MNAEKETTVLDDKKINTVFEISSDETFKSKTIDNMTNTKISELSEEIQAKFKKELITDTSPEYTEYLRVLKAKMLEAKEDNKKIKTV